MDSLIARLAPYSIEVLGKLTPVLPENIKAFPLRLIRPHSLVATWL